MKTRQKIAVSIAAIIVAGIGYQVYGHLTADERMQETCAAIKPGMSFAQLKEFAADHSLRPPPSDSGLMYLADRRSFGRHACKLLLEHGVVKQSEHNYAD
jgi:hypothetical protein